MSKKNDLKAMALITTALSKTVDIADIAADKAKAGMTEAKEVRADLEAHKDVCTERAGNIDYQIKEIKQTMKENGVVYAAAFAEIKKDMGKMNGRLLSVLVTVLVGVCGGFAALAFYIMTHKGI